MGDAKTTLDGPSDEYQSVSVRVEKIKNGYLEHRSESGPGGYSSDTVFHKEKPQVSLVPSAKPPKTNSLKEAFKCLKVLVLVIGLSTAQAQAQSPVVTFPGTVPAATGSNASSTIGVTNTFQSVFAAVTTQRGRAMCLVQNNGAAAMFVFLGAPTAATTPTSIQLNTRETFTCDRPGGVTLQDQVSITGTAGQFFLAIQR